MRAKNMHFLFKQGLQSYEKSISPSTKKICSSYANKWLSQHPIESLRDETYLQAVAFESIVNSKIKNQFQNIIRTIEILKLPSEKAKYTLNIFEDFLEWTSYIDIRVNYSVFNDVFKPLRELFSLNELCSEGIFEKFPPSYKKMRIVQCIFGKDTNIIDEAKTICRWAKINYDTTLTRKQVENCLYENTNIKSLEEWIEWCKHSNKLAVYKLRVAQYLNPQLEKSLEKLYIEEKKIYKEISLIAQYLKVDKKYLFELHRRLGGISLLEKKPVLGIVNIIKNSKNALPVYLYTKYILEKLGRNKDLTLIERCLPLCTMGQTVESKFLSTATNWEKELYYNIVQTYSQNTEMKSSFPERNMKVIKNRILNFLNNIKIYMKENYPQFMEKNSFIYLFCQNMNLEDIRQFLIWIGEKSKADNDVVKSTHLTHHATHDINMTLIFIRLLPLLPCKKELQKLKVSSITSFVSNKRIPVSKRRVITDEEINQMFEVVKNNKKEKLVLTLLVEIGLRANAICNIKFKHLIDDNFQPRHICRVPEKQKTIREFVTSVNLKKCIIYYFNSLDRNSVKMEDYMFQVENLRHKPLNYGWLNNMIHRIARDAKIIDIIIHPHLFRHTAVGKLIDCGNSMEIVSKFMGHKSIDTTNKYYWIKDPVDLYNEINNPFIYKQPTEEEIKDEQKWEIEKLNTKVNYLLTILDKYQEIIISNSEEDKSAQNVLSDIHKQLPNLHSMMRKIVDSVAETSCTEPSIISKEMN